MAHSCSPGVRGAGNSQKPLNPASALLPAQRAGGGGRGRGLLAARTLPAYPLETAQWQLSAMRLPSSPAGAYPSRSAFPAPAPPRAWPSLRHPLASPRSAAALPAWVLRAGGVQGRTVPGGWAISWAVRATREGLCSELALLLPGRLWSGGGVGLRTPTCRSALADHGEQGEKNLPVLLPSF